jgi:hypothetical protein
LAEKLEVDTQEIDHSISYYENKEHLVEIGKSKGAMPSEHEEEALSYLEEQAGSLGRRVVTEEEHEKLVDLSLRLEKLREKEKHLKSAEKDFEARRNIAEGMKQLENKVEHRETNGKIKGHRKPVSCASLRGTCRSKGLSKKGCGTTLPLRCKRKRKGVIERAAKEKKSGLPDLPSLPSLPALGSMD